MIVLLKIGGEICRHHKCRKSVYFEWKRNSFITLCWLSCVWGRLKLAAAWICGYDIDKHYNFACNNLLTPIGWKWYRLHVGTVSQGRAGHRLYIISKDPKPPADLLSAELSVWDLFYMYILNGAVHLSYIKHVVTTDIWLQSVISSS